MPQRQAREALDLALLLHAEPLRARAARALPLPAGTTEVLRAALGNSETLESASADLGADAAELSRAARFFIEQLMLARECEGDPWRVLGLRPDAAQEQLREHRRLLLSLVHPDRGGDWPAAYYDRVQQAWLAIKGGEANAAARGVGSPTGDWDAPARAAVPTADAGAANRGLSPTQNRMPPTSGVRRRWWVGGAALVVSALVFMPEWVSDELVVFPTGEVAVDATRAAPVPPPSPRSDGAAAPTAITQPEATAGVGERAVAGQSILVQTDPSRAPPQRSAPDPVSTGVAVAPASPGPTQPVRRPGPLDAASASASASAPTRRGVAQDAIEVSAVGVDPQQPSVATETRANRVPIARGAAAAPAASESSASPAMTMDTRAAAPEAAPEVALAVRPRAESSSAAADALLPAPASPVDIPAAPSAALHPTDAQAVVVLESFRARYESGDLDGLLKLFSMRDRTDGGAALALDYSRLFDSTRERRLALSDLRWRANGDRLEGAGRFKATYLQQGRFGRVAVQGAMHFEVVLEDDTPRLLRLDSTPGRG